MDVLAAEHHSEDVRCALVADCLERVLSDIATCRDLRDWHARPKKHPVSELNSARDQDLNKRIDRSLANPTNEQEVLVAIYSGAKKAKVIESRRLGRIVEDRVVFPDGHSDWVRGDLTWLTELRRHPQLLKRAISKIPNLKLRQHSTKSIVRRMRELSQNPTRQRLESLIRDAANPGGGPNYVLSALRSAARSTVYAARKLPGSWLNSLKTDPGKIAQVAAEAHRSLVEAGPGEGAIRDHDLEHYCDRIAEIWKDLATADITYATATETSPRPDKQRYGIGLAFMRHAMALIDASVTVGQARAQIDRIRKWRTSHSAD
jgi:hypothetical protein